jgi:hypothetical protein
MSHDPTDIWDADSEAADSYLYVNSTDMVSNYIDSETQEWTNEDTAKTTQCIQMLESIVKGQFSTSDDVEFSPFFLRSDGVDSPSPNAFRRPNGSAVNQSHQPVQQYAHAIDDYEPFEGKDSIFDDVASGRNSRPSLSRENSDSAYLTHDSRPPKSPATDPFEPQFVKSRGKGIIDPHLSETVERASSKLRKFQRKIIRTIENSPEVRKPFFSKLAAAVENAYIFLFISFHSIS